MIAPCRISPLRDSSPRASSSRRATLARFALLGVASALAPLTSCGGAAEEPVLRITALPDHRTTELDPKYSAVARALSETLGVAVEYVAVADYGASVAAFKSGDVQLAWFGGVTGVQARAAVPGARVIAFGETDGAFRSSFVANASLGLEPSDAFPTGLKGVRFTFGNADSTSGRVMPEHFVREATGGPPEDFFGEVNPNGGKHPIVARSVETGSWDAGVLNYRTYRDLVERGEIDPARCVEIWQTPTYADYNWTAHPSLDETFGAGFIDRLQAALVGIEDAALLEALQRPEGLVPASNDNFRALAELCHELGLVSG